MTEETALNLAEILYETGELKFRYERIPSGTRWIRHGLFQAFHKNGQLSTEGSYANGLEEGLWRDYHPNGTLAAEGHYRAGKEVGTWRFWGADGKPERTETF